MLGGMTEITEKWIEMIELITEMTTILTGMTRISEIINEGIVGLFLMS